MPELTEETKSYLHNKLVKLGDMMGDGLHLEPDGKWISVEYRKILRALGVLSKKKNNSAIINERMVQRTNDVSCGKCSGRLRQVRSGSKRAICESCGAKWQLLK